MRPADQKPTVADFDFDARDVGGQVVVYDHARSTIHVLDWVTAYVWYLCDGEHTVSDMCRELTQETGDKFRARVVEKALDELEAVGFVDPAARAVPDGPAWAGRREFLLRAAAFTGAGIVTPAILSVGGATPAAAASTVPVFDALRGRLGLPTANEVNPTTTSTTSTTPFPTTSTSTSTTPAPTTTSTSTTPAPTTTSTSTTPGPTTTSTTPGPTTQAPTTTSTSSTPAPTTTLGPSLPPEIREALEAIVDSLERFGDTFHEVIAEIDDILRRFRSRPSSFLSR